ncbi:MAG: four helix bundle protein [Chloroflexota bacterium]|nr:four helix bundle protein [Chloroflexota bacterium]
MAKAERFEDLHTWQKARALTAAIYGVTRHGGFAKDFGLANQIQRAAVSVMSNIAEGFERGGLPEFHHFLGIAKASCGEVRSQLYIALDVGYLDTDQFGILVMQAEEVSKMLAGLRDSVERKRIAQQKPSQRSKST